MAETTIKNHFTIIIPTRERKDTLVHTIRSVLNQNYDEYSIIVSDNYSQDGTEELVESFSNSRIIYINTGKRVSMSHNWEFALNYVKGGWVTILGDDDALLPGSLGKVNEIINKTKIQAIRSNGCSYRWPGLNEAAHGNLTVSLKKGYKVLKSLERLQLSLRGELPYIDLPVLYNGGFVNTEVLRKIKIISGCYIKSLNPDVYLGVVISLLTEEYVYSEEPLAINGASKHSGGTAFFERNVNDKENNPFSKFIQEDNIPFHPEIPLMPNGIPVRSLQILLYEAYLQAYQFHKSALVVTHKMQLEIILNNDFRKREEVLIFSELFMQKHNIQLNNYQELSQKRTPGKNKKLLKIFSWPAHQLRRFLSLWTDSIGVSGNTDIQVNNVYDASLVAGVFLAYPVGGFFWNIKLLLRKRL